MSVRIADGKRNFFHLTAIFWRCCETLALHATHGFLKQICMRLSIVYMHSSVVDPYDLGLPDPHPDPLVTSTDTAPDPSILKEK